MLKKSLNLGIKPIFSYKKKIFSHSQLLHQYLIQFWKSVIADPEYDFEHICKLFIYSFLLRNLYTIFC